jgi:hypothetical protein
MKRALEILNDESNIEVLEVAHGGFLTSFEPSTAVSSFEGALEKLVGVKDK